MFELSSDYNIGTRVLLAPRGGGGGGGGSDKEIIHQLGFKIISNSFDICTFILYLQRCLILFGF